MNISKWLISSIAFGLLFQSLPVFAACKNWRYLGCYCIIADQGPGGSNESTGRTIKVPNIDNPPFCGDDPFTYKTKFQEYENRCSQVTAIQQLKVENCNASGRPRTAKECKVDGRPKCMEDGPL